MQLKLQHNNIHAFPQTIGVIKDSSLFNNNLTNRLLQSFNCNSPLVSILPNYSLYFNNPGTKARFWRERIYNMSCNTEMYEI